MKSLIIRNIFLLFFGATLAITALFALSGCFRRHEHYFYPSWSVNDEAHWHMATCGHNVIADYGLHEYGEDDRCIVCNSPKPHTEHTLEYYERKEPDCTENGYIEHYRCTVCGRYFTDAEGSNQVYYNSVVIKATGHSFDYLLSHDETHHYYASTCGHDVRRDEEEHKFSGDTCRICLYRPGYEDVHKDNVRYTLSEGGQSYYVSGNTIDTMKGVIIASEIDGKPVTEIAERAFYDCPGLTGVVIPESVTNIGAEAFRLCTRLTSITFTNSVKTIESYAFTECIALFSVSYGGSIADWCEIDFTDTGANPAHALSGSYAYLYIDGEPVKDLVIPDGVTEIKKEAFALYDNLHSVTFPDSVESIGRYAFYSCDLRTITFGNGLKRVDDDAFSPNSYLQTVNVPSLEAWCNISFGEGYANPLVIWIYDSMSELDFEKSQLLVNSEVLSGEITLPEGITEIPAYTFKLSNVTRVIVPDGVQKIGVGAFYKCEKLTSVEIPDSVEIIADYAFCKCFDLFVPAANGAIEIGNYAFSQCTGGGTVLDELVVPDGVKTIGKYAYYRVRAKKLILPASVERIDSQAFYNWFYLNEIEVDPANEVYKSEGNCLIERATGTIIKGCVSSVIPDDGSIKAIGDYAFSSCDLVDGFTIPFGVITIGREAFEDNDMTTLVIPESVTSIGVNAFDECRKLVYLTLPDSVTYMPDLGNFYLYWSAETKAELYDEDGALYIGNHLIDARRIEGEYTVKDGTVTISNYPVLGNSLTSITVPDSVVYIEGEVFKRLNSLTTVRLGRGITELPNDMFIGCDNLQTVYITDSVTKLGGNIFESCEKLSDVYYDGTLEQWNAIEKEQYWNVSHDKLNFTVHCSDGEIEYNK